MTGSRRFAIGLGVLLAGQLAFLGWMIADRVSLLGSDRQHVREVRSGCRGRVVEEHADAKQADQAKVK